MSATVLEELPLFRAKGGGGDTLGGTGPNVGPGSYDPHTTSYCNNSLAPFNTTSERPPLSLADPAIPGPGSYDQPEENVKRGIASCPFLSESARFQTTAGDSVPGPGAYELGSATVTRKTPRAHRFATTTDRNQPICGAGTLGPGDYNPKGTATNRAFPRQTDFGRASGRGRKTPEETPGPGSYDVARKPRSLYGAKPSSMFATRLPRSQPPVLDTPGPGSYNVLSGLGGRSGSTGVPFGSTAHRFPLNDDSERPGPGSYTGVIALRRPVAESGCGTAAFASRSGRFNGGAETVPGPGAYDGRLLPKHIGFSGETPFGSTVPRFGTTTSHRANGAPRTVTTPPAPPRFPRRTAPRRSFVDGDISPSDHPKPLPDRNYNINYEWPKPTTTRPSNLGQAPRFAAADRRGPADAQTPGPGSYLGTGKAGVQNTRFQNSMWPRDVRFSAAPTVGGGGPGEYFHATTLLTKSHNATIGSDDTWLH